MMIGLMLYFSLIARWRQHEHPLKLLKRKAGLFQSGTSGLAGVLESYAYSFAPASVVMAGKRGSLILWSIITGNVYFKEKHPAIKLTAFLCILVGLWLLA